MKRLSLAALAACLSAVCLAAPPAHADLKSNNTVEPIVSIAGGQVDCDVSYNDGAGSWFQNVATDPATSWGVTALQASQVYVWTSVEDGVPGDQTYRLCEWDTSVPKLAENLYRRLSAKTHPTTGDAGWQGKKVDIIASSVGAVIGRWCVAKVSGCAALVDDFIGLVPPNYGTSLATASNCPYMGTFGAYGLCMALGTNHDVIQQLGGLPDPSPTYEGQWTNNGVDDTPSSHIEWTTFWTSTDGVIQHANRARLMDGAHNIRIYKPSNQLSHGTAISNSVCPGATRWQAPTAVEWAVYLALDVMPTPNTTTTSTESILNCYVFPEDDDATTSPASPAFPSTT